MTGFEIDVPKQLRDRVVRLAVSAGQTEQEFILAAIVEKIERSERFVEVVVASSTGMTVAEMREQDLL